MQDVRRFGHLHQESTASSSDVIDRPHPRKDAIHQANGGLGRRHKAAHLSQQDDERRLAQIRGLASHVRPGQDEQLLRRAVEIEVIGHKAIERALDHRMAPLAHADTGAVIDTGPHVVV